MGKSMRMVEIVVVEGESSSQQAPQTVWMQSDNGGSQVHSSDQQQVESDDNVNENLPRRRSKTVLEDVWRLPSNRRIKVRANMLRQPVGLGAKTFSNYCGVVVRNHCPLNYTNWSKVPRGTKSDIVNLMKKKFLYPVAITSWLNKSMSKKWRDYKSFLKKRFFYPRKSEEFNIANCPPDVQINQWQFLVSFWMSDKGKKLERDTKKSRSFQMVTHTTGSKTFARKAHELELEAGEPVGNIKLYEVTHTRKDGTYLDPEVLNIVKLAKAKKAEKSQTQTSSTDIFMEELEIICEVTGAQRNGRVRGLGLGPTPSTVFGPRASISASMHSEEEFINLQREVVEQRAIIKEQTAMMKKLEAQMALILTHIQQNSDTAATTNNTPKPNIEPTMSARPNDVAQEKNVEQPSQTTAKVFVTNVSEQVKPIVGLNNTNAATTEMKSKTAHVTLQKGVGNQMLKRKAMDFKPKCKAIGGRPTLTGQGYIPYSCRGQNGSASSSANRVVHRRVASSHSSLGLIGAETRS